MLYNESRQSMPQLNSSRVTPSSAGAGHHKLRRRVSSPETYFKSTQVTGHINLKRIRKVERLRAIGRLMYVKGHNNIAEEVAEGSIDL
jgi:hypothetical protein